MSVVMILSGGTLLASIAAYKYVLGDTPLWGRPSHGTFASNHPGGRMRARNEPWSHLWSDISPNVTENGGHQSVTPDTIRKARHQLAIGGTILPRKRML